MNENIENEEQFTDDFEDNEELSEMEPDEVELEDEEAPQRKGCGRGCILFMLVLFVILGSLSLLLLYRGDTLFNLLYAKEKTHVISQIREYSNLSEQDISYINERLETIERAIFEKRLFLSDFIELNEIDKDFNNYTEDNILTSEELLEFTTRIDRLIDNIVK